MGAEELDALVAAIEAADDLCGTCGHPRAWHIYHEGACRGGFVCASACDEFTSPPAEGGDDGGPARSTPPPPPPDDTFVRSTDDERAELAAELAALDREPPPPVEGDDT